MIAPTDAMYKKNRCSVFYRHSEDKLIFIIYKSSFYEVTMRTVFDHVTSSNIKIQKCTLCFDFILNIFVFMKYYESPNASFVIF